MPNDHKYFGKYRGTVANNVDPELRGRIMAIVPDVTGPIPGTWALPCLPFVGIQQGVYCVPPIGAGVWIEYEQGDPDYPVWTGGWWSALDVPAALHAYPAPVPVFAVMTPLQNSLIVSDVPGPLGGILLKSTTGATIQVNDLGITIQNGQGASITMVGPTTTINAGALEVI